ncbi:MAG: hypothetical protein Kow0058_14200 [Roseovarius sp.]
MSRIEEARQLHRLRAVRWGYVWAMWCAVLWGAWYLPGAAIWTVPPFSGAGADGAAGFLAGAVVITSLSSIGVLLFLLLWLAVLEKLGEFWRTMRQFRRIAKWYFLAAIFGGPCALLGSFLAIGFVGPVFAAVATLLYPIVGATMARLWYHEKITLRAGAGIGVIVIGGIAIFVPGLTGEAAQAGDLVWIGYLGGFLAAFGWGVEGAVAGRALDISDPDVGITIRFAAEAAYWLVLLLPAAALWLPAPVFGLAAAAFAPAAGLWLLLSGLSFAFCYVTWYKSFPLIGVGRGQAIGALHAVFAVIFLAIFAFDLPDWNFVLGLALTIGGTWLMVTEPAEVVEIVRDTSGLAAPAGALHLAPPPAGGLHMKGFILALLAAAGERGLWDYEIMQALVRRYRRDSAYWRGELRITLTDLHSGALIDELEDALDDGRHFGPDRILMRFRISPFGHQRLRDAGLVAAGPPPVGAGGAP